MSTSALSNSFGLNELEAAILDASNWAVLEGTLYGLCHQYPFHTDRAGSNAKVWLIGRGLATGIERQVKSTGGQGSNMLTLCDHVYQNRNQVDEIISRLREIEEPLDEGKLEIIVREHGRFCHLISPILNGRSPRSFAAKYLHCHCPALPIFDNVAWKRLGEVCLWNDNFKVFDLPKDADKIYYWFSLRFLPFYKEVRLLRPNATVRQLDLYLLWNSAATVTSDHRVSNEKNIGKPAHNRFVMDSIEGVKLVYPDGRVIYAKDIKVPPDVHEESLEED